VAGGCPYPYRVALHLDAAQPGPSVCIIYVTPAYFWF
jgi:hypothetical protein